MVRKIALIVIIAYVFGLLGILAESALSAPTDAGPWPNNCNGWARMNGKEGIVRDSITMHMLGCDDKKSPTHYHATIGTERQNYCTKRARWYARWGWFGRPQTVARMVMTDLPFCFVFEDGTYGTYDYTSASP